MVVVDEVIAGATWSGCRGDVLVRKNFFAKVRLAELSPNVNEE
jgi:hypothetical protein